MYDVYVQLRVAFLLWLPFISLITALGVDDKLDFGHRTNHPPFARGRPNEKDRFLPVKYTKIHENSDNFNNIGIVCVTEGCNVTKSSETEKGAEVIVRVETRVNLNDNKTKEIVEETPDVPVVLGYRGTNSGADGIETPSYNAIYSPISNTGQIPPTNPLNSNRRTSFMPSFVPGLAHYSFPEYTRNYYSSQPTGPNINTHHYNPTSQIGSVPSVEPNFRINFKTIPPMSLSVHENNGDYHKNTMGVVIPYFDPSHHNHYYGENPPQLIHYPKMHSLYNPVEFKTVKTTWSPSLLYNAIPQGHYGMTADSGVKCTCQNGHNVPGMTWYPGNNRKHFDVNPGVSVDDKLAPLN